MEAGICFGLPSISSVVFWLPLVDRSEFLVSSSGDVGVRSIIESQGKPVVVWCMITGKKYVCQGREVGGGIQGPSPPRERSFPLSSQTIARQSSSDCPTSIEIVCSKTCSCLLSSRHLRTTESATLALLRSRRKYFPIASSSWSRASCRSSGS
jgi:hypothetical protein